MDSKELGSAKILKRVYVKKMMELAKVYSSPVCKKKKKKIRDKSKSILQIIARSMQNQATLISIISNTSDKRRFY